MNNSLLYGDNLPVMRGKIADASVDLVYLDPPFNSDLNYNVLFKADGLHSDEAQVTAFKDTWTWDAAAQAAYDELQNVRNPTLVNFINALHGGLSRSPMLAYLVNMALRIVEIHRVLKPTGSVYLHCDPTASHYLKDEYQSCSGEEKTIYLAHEETFKQARSDDDGAAVPGIVWGRTTVRGAAKPAALAGGFQMPALQRAEPWLHGRTTGA